MVLQRILDTVRTIKTYSDTIQSKISALANSLNSVGTDNILTIINGDNVGLAKDTTLNTVNTSIQELYVDHIGDYVVSLANTGTAAVFKPALSSNVTISKSGVYAIVIALDTATEVKLSVTIGTKSYDYLLNDGNALTADAWYEFDICLSENDAINFEINVPAGGSVSGLIRIFRK